MSLRAVLALLAGLVVVLRLLLARQKRRRQALTAASRGLLCPECGARRVVPGRGLTLPTEAAGSLEHQANPLEHQANPLEHQATSLQLQAISCRACTFRGVAVRSEDAVPRGYRLDWQEHAAFTLAVERCPAPADPGCACPEHRRFGRREGGRWVGLAEITRDPLGVALDVARP